MKNVAVFLNLFLGVLYIYLYIFISFYLFSSILLFILIYSSINTFLSFYLYSSILLSILFYPSIYTPLSIYLYSSILLSIILYPSIYIPLSIYLYSSILLSITPLFFYLYSSNHYIFSPSMKTRRDYFIISHRVQYYKFLMYNRTYFLCFKQKSVKYCDTVVNCINIIYKLTIPLLILFGLFIIQLYFTLWNI